MLEKFISKKSVQALIIALCLVCLPFNFAAAEEEEAESPPDFTLETIYVTGKGDSAENESKQKVSVDVKDKIDAGQINTVTDILRNIAGFTVQEQHQGGTKVSMRGVDNERMLVAINGNIVENPGHLMRGRGFEWDMIPITNVQKIEIIRGASNAEYGGTWGGVVNIVTIQEPGEMSTILKSSYGSFNTSKFAITNQGTTKDGKFSWTANANKNKSDGYFRNNWSDTKDFNLNLSYKLNEEDKLSFAWTTINREQGMIVYNTFSTDSTVIPDYDPNYPHAPNPFYRDNGVALYDGSYRIWKGNNYSLNYSTATSKLNLYLNKQFREEWEKNVGTDPVNGKKVITPFKNVWESDITNNGINWQKNLDKGDHQLTYGVQYRTMDFEIYTTKSNIEADNKSAFLQDDWRVKNDVVIGLGMRYDSHSLDMQTPGRTHDASKSQLSPKLSVTKQLSSKEAVYASASSVFRSPTQSDYSRWSSNYFTWDAVPPARPGNGKQIIEHPDNAWLGITNQAEWQKAMGVVMPEHGMAYELGWKKQASDKFGWRVTGFYNDIDDYINFSFPKPITNTPVTYNIKNAKIKGLELSTDYVFNDKLSSVFTFTRQVGTKTGDFLDRGTALTSLPQNTFNFGLRWQANEKFRTALDTRYIGPQEVSGSSLGGHAVTDLSFLFQHQDVSYLLAICNIFDKEYQEYRGYTMPGTTYYVSCQLKF